MWFLKKLFKKRDEAAQKYAETNPSVDEDGEVVKPFLDHLEDLRWMLIKSLVALFGTMTIAFGFRSSISAFLKQPLIQAVGEANASLQSIDPIGSISISISLSFYTGFVVSFPFIMYFVAEFFLPALTKKEKRYVIPGVLVGFILFLVGVFVAFYFVLPPMLRWLHNDQVAMQIDPNWTIELYYKILTQISIALGLICELPVVMVVLNGIGLMSATWLRSMRLYGYASALIVAIIVAPTTDITMIFFMALPILILFEACIWLVYFLESWRNRREARALLDPNEPID